MFFSIDSNPDLSSHIFGSGLGLVDLGDCAHDACPSGAVPDADRLARRIPEGARGNRSFRGAESQRRRDHLRARGIRTPRPGWRGISDGAQVAHGARLLLQLRTHVGRRQRGRRRTRHVQGPNDPSQRSVPGSRGRTHCGPRGRRRPDHRRDQAVLRGRGRSLAEGDRRSQGRGLVRRHRDRGVRRSEGVSVRRRDRAPGNHRRALPVSPHRAAIPARCPRSSRVGRRSRVGEWIVGPCRDGRARRRHRGAAGAGRQCRDARERCADHRPRRGVVPHRRNARVSRNDRVHRDRLYPP